MSVLVQGLKFNALEIFSLDKETKVDITANVLSVDYFEDILSPCITTVIYYSGTSSLYNTLPIRGGEKIVMDISTPTGDFVLDGDYGMYVYKVSGYVTNGSQESFALHLVSREGLTNETARVQKKYQKKTIDEHVTSILKDVLQTSKYESKNIEKTSNTYSFIGNQKKPFHILTWLCPKGVPVTSSSGTSGQIAKGVAGYLFFENKNGFNFKSVEKMISGTTYQNNIPIYTYNSAQQSNTEESIHGDENFLFVRVKLFRCER